MPFRAYTSGQREEALDVLTQCGRDLKAAHAELSQRWGHAPSLSTLSTWLLSGPNGQGQANTPKAREGGQNEALKRLEGCTASPWEKLLEAVSHLAQDPDFAVVVIVRRSLQGERD